MGEAKRRGTYEQRKVRILDGVRPMTPERYNAFVAWTRSPIASVVGQELEFYSTPDEHLIGVLIKDRFDRDFGYVVMGRDEALRFRCIDVSASLTENEARKALVESVNKHAATGEKIFPQGADAVGVDLFTSVVPEERLHPYFKLLQTGDHWIPARSIMSEMMRSVQDVDGNLVEQFQTAGFDARIWELYLHAALLDIGLFVSKPKPAPDFMLDFGERKVFVEAVTVGPSRDAPIPVPGKEPAPRPPEEVKELLKGKIPIKFGSALYSKLAKKNPYWELEHVKGHPFVLAVADFHESQSMTWTSPALMEYLYGVTHDFHADKDGQLIISPLKIETHEFDGKKIPSGFFLQPKSEHVSAVLFTSSGTISKFNRMGRLAGFGLPEQRMFRSGLEHDHDPNAVFPKPFFHEVEQGKIKEAWKDGLSMFHNPKAAHPIEADQFPGIAHHFFDAAKGQIVSYLPEFHVHSSMTWNFIARDGDPQEGVSD